MIRDEMRFFANHGHGDDMNVSFQVAEVRSVPERPQYNTNKNCRESSMFS